VARVSGRPIADAKDALSEIALDSRLVDQLQVAVRSSPRRGLMDQSVRLGRRMGWYALVRLLEPQHVVETGTDKGLGTCALAAAVLRNGKGSVTTIDINPASGSLIVEPYGSAVDRRIGDSIEILASLADVDFFIHDSDHSASYESRELAAVTPALTGDGPE
jgi:predicted O-methyltransferase YrrM